MEGCYVCDDEGEATIVPSKSFLGQPPLWRIDVLQDLMYDFELARRHAIVEWAQSLARSNPQVDEADRLRVFREACEQLGTHIPENFEPSPGATTWPEAVLFDPDEPAQLPGRDHPGSGCWLCTLAALTTALCTSSLWLSTPMCSFMPK
jgi:hypothetical protein